MIRENLESIRAEAYAAYWWCRCKAAATAAQITLALVIYCRWRGERAKVAAWFARRFCSLAHRLMPAAIRPNLET